MKKSIVYSMCGGVILAALPIGYLMTHHDTVSTQSSPKSKTIKLPKQENGANTTSDAVSGDKANTNTNDSASVDLSEHVTPTIGIVGDSDVNTSPSVSSQTRSKPLYGLVNPYHYTYSPSTGVGNITPTSDVSDTSSHLGNVDQSDQITKTLDETVTISKRIDRTTDAVVVERIEDPTLDKGQVVTVQEGYGAVYEQTFQTVYDTAGNVLSEEALSDRHLVKEGKATIIHIGTKENPSSNGNGSSDGSVSETPLDTTQSYDETTTSAIAYETVTVDDDTLAKGQTKLVQAGQTGELTEVYHVTTDGNGTVTSKQLVSSTRTKEPVNQIVHVGTKVAADDMTSPSSDDAITNDNGDTGVTNNDNANSNANTSLSNQTTTRTSKVITTIPVTEDIVYDDTLLVGSRVTTDEGQAGQTVQIKTETLDANGNVLSASLSDPTSDSITMRPRVVHVGTKVDTSSTTPDTDSSETLSKGVQSVTTTTTKIPMTTEYVDNPDLPVGTETVAQTGRDGVRVTKTITIRDSQTGAILSTKTEDDPTQAIAMIPQIVERGTKVETPSINPATDNTSDGGGNNAELGDATNTTNPNPSTNNSDDTTNTSDNHGTDDTTSESSNTPTPSDHSVDGDDTTGKNPVDNGNSNDNSSNSSTSTIPSDAPSVAEKPVYTINRTVTVEKTTIPMTTQVEDDDSLDKGAEIVVQEGHDGVVATNHIVYTNKEGAIVHEVTTPNTDESIDMLPQIVKRGTRDALVTTHTTESETVPYTTTRVEDPTLEKGQEVVRQVGQAGTVVYDVTVVTNSLGEELSRTRVVNPTLSVAATDEIIHVGTKDVTTTNDDTASSGNGNNNGGTGGHDSVYTTATRTVTLPVAYNTIVKEDPEMDAMAAEIVDVEGQEGVRTVTYQDTYKNGILTKSTFVSDAITTNPVDKVIVKGTKINGVIRYTGWSTKTITTKATTIYVDDPTLDWGVEKEDPNTTLQDGIVKIVTTTLYDTDKNVLARQVGDPEVVQELQNKIIYKGTKSPATTDMVDNVTITYEAKTNYVGAEEAFMEAFGSLTGSMTLAELHAMPQEWKDKWQDNLNISYFFNKTWTQEEINYANSLIDKDLLNHYFLELMNAKRAELDAQDGNHAAMTYLGQDAKISQYANQRSSEMAVYGSCRYEGVHEGAHKRPDGSSYSTVFGLDANASSAMYPATAENLAELAGSLNPIKMMNEKYLATAMFTLWWNSKGHRANMMLAGNNLHVAVSAYFGVNSIVFEGASPIVVFTQLIGSPNTNYTVFTD